MKIWFDHIGIACTSNDQSMKFWELLGFSKSGSTINEEQGVKITFMQGDEALQPKLELLEPTHNNTPIGKFISKKGEGIQQLALGTDDIKSLLEKLKRENIRLINEDPVQGANNTKIAFVHPESTGGVLVEIVQK
tara:strand:+ start:101 stop:505 length:405 start_codon:yes stop_codon:yes gene_type:complete